MKPTSYDLCNEAMSLEREIKPLEQYYRDKKASLMYHLDSVDDNHPILLEIANEIEEVRNQRNILKLESRHKELVEEFNLIESFDEIDKDIDKFIKQAEEEWENENRGKKILKTARIIRGKGKFYPKPYRKLYRKQKK